MKYKPAQEEVPDAEPRPQAPHHQAKTQTSAQSCLMLDCLISNHLRDLSWNTVPHGVKPPPFSNSSNASCLLNATLLQSLIIECSLFFILQSLSRIVICISSYSSHLKSIFCNSSRSSYQHFYYIKMYLSVKI